MKIIKKSILAKTLLDICNNHTGCTSETSSDGGGLECGGSVTD